MKTITFNEISEGEFITFSRQTKNKETVQQLGFVSRTNATNDTDESPLENIEVYLAVEAANAPKVRFDSTAIPQEETEQLGLKGQYIIFQIPIRIQPDDLAEPLSLGTLSDNTTSQIYEILDDWEDKAGRNLKFFRPNQLAGTGFNRFTPPTKSLTETHTDKSAPAADTKQTKTSPASTPPAKAATSKGGYKAPRPNYHYPDDAWDIAP